MFAEPPEFPGHGQDGDSGKKDHPGNEVGDQRGVGKNKDGQEKQNPAKNNYSLRQRPVTLGKKFVCKRIVINHGKPLFQKHFFLYYIHKIHHSACQPPTRRGVNKQELIELRAWLLAAKSISICTPAGHEG